MRVTYPAGYAVIDQSRVGLKPSNAYKPPRTSATVFRFRIHLELTFQHCRYTQLFVPSPASMVGRIAVRQYLEAGIAAFDICRNSTSVLLILALPSHFSCYRHLNGQGSSPSRYPGAKYSTNSNHYSMTM